MVDRLFSDPALAGLYDRFHPSDGRGDFTFYLPLVMSADSVLDLGCGTGQLLRMARQAGHEGNLCGVDPAKAMIDQARSRSDIDWIVGDLRSVRRHPTFELIVMTGHAFQVLLSDAEVVATLTSIRYLLREDGRLAFETRNPTARQWESWTPDDVREATDCAGTVVNMAHEVEVPFDGHTVSFATTFSSSNWDTPQVSRSTLRFLDARSLSSLLSHCGLVIEQQFGDWSRRPLTGESPEIITVARRRTCT